MATFPVAFAVAVQASDAVDDRFDLDIERQSAGAALVELGESTDIQIAAPSGAARGIDLGPIKGSYTVVDALEALLEGSDLGYRFIADSVAIVFEQSKLGGEGVEREARTEADDAGPQVDHVEVVITTGSRLSRAPGQMDRQVVEYDRLEIELSGATSMEEFARRIPQSFNAPSSNGAAFAGSFGSTSNYFGAAGVNLRGLGERATLVLIDGRRTARGGVFGEATDVNQIPLSMIERIEVIFDGASAIYGADAAGGVVNFVTREDYHGVDVSIRHSWAQQGGTAETRTTFGDTHGWGDENQGSLTLSYERLVRDPLNGDERDLGFATGTGLNLLGRYELADAPPYGWPPNLRGDLLWVPGSGYVVGPLFLLDANGDPVEVGDPTGVTEIYVSRMPQSADGELSLADFKGLEVQAGSRPGSGRGLIPGRDDHSWRVSLRQELSDRLSFESAISVNRSDTNALESNQNHVLTATPLHTTSWGPAGTPHTPFQGSVEIWAEFPFLPDVERSTEKEALHAHLGLHGRFGQAWGWEVVAAHSASGNRGLQLNKMSRANLFCVTNPLTNGCSRDTRLGMLNMSDLPYFGLNSEQEFIAAFVMPPLRTTSESTDMEYTLSLRGPLFRAPGGVAQSLFSVSRRSEATYLFDETLTVQGHEWFGTFPNRGYDPDRDVGGYEDEITRNTDSASFEMNVPLVGGDNIRSGLNGLDVTLSGRHDDITSGDRRIIEQELVCCPYAVENLSTTATFGYSITAWSVGFVWRSTDWLRVRGNVNSSYAAPPMTSYVHPTLRHHATHVFRHDNGVPIPDENGDWQIVDIVRVRGGNLDLLPESNTTRSFGFDLTPEVIPNLVARLNFHWNEMVDRIGRLEPSTRGFSPELLTADLPHIKVDEATGRLVWPFSGERFNLGRVSTKGVDLNLGYHVESRYGVFDARFDYAYLRESLWRHVDDCGPESVNCASPVYGHSIDVVGHVPYRVRDGRGGFFLVPPYAVVPRHRFDLRFGWAWRGWRVDVAKTYQSATSRGVGRFDSATEEVLPGTSTVTAANPVDLVIRYDFEKAGHRPELLRHTRIELMVANVLDDNAEFDLEPKFASDRGGVFDPIASRPRGRAFTLTIGRKFMAR